MVTADSKTIIIICIIINSANNGVFNNGQLLARNINSKCPAVNHNA
jgi:hypothetical protein